MVHAGPGVEGGINTAVRVLAGKLGASCDNYSAIRLERCPVSAEGLKVRIPRTRGHETDSVDEHLAVRLHNQRVNDFGNLDARIKGWIQTSIGIQPGDVGAADAMDGAKVAGHEQFSV